LAYNFLLLMVMARVRVQNHKETHLENVRRAPGFTSTFQSALDRRREREGGGEGSCIE
jgi:hypothetical protein